MSLEKKVTIGMFTILTGWSCTENNSTKLGSVRMYEAVTDSDGKVFFTEEETGEEVEVKVVIKDTGFPVSGAAVIYFDNVGSEGFLISHPKFQPQLNLALHNSDHQYPISLTPAAIPHKGAGKEQSKLGAARYASWAEANWEHTGCLNRDNMVTLMKPGAFLMKKLSGIETFGVSEEKFDEGVQYIEKNLPKSTTADTYVFVPYKYGFSASTATITAFNFRPDGNCGYGNSGSSGAEGEENNNSADNCPGMLFCDEFGGTALDNKWNIINDSGISLSDGWLTLPNASSIAAQNQFGDSCIDKRVDIQSTPTPYRPSVYLGNMGLSAGNKTGILSCDGTNGANVPVDLSGAENGFSLYKSGGLLSLKISDEITSIPCWEDISYVQLTAGLNDQVKVDYVRVKCN